MDNLWLLTEERPKPSVIKQILDAYSSDFSTSYHIEGEIKIKPIIKDNIFTFTYVVEGVQISNIDTLYIKTVSGSSSFLDFLLFKQKDEPSETGYTTDNLIMAIEETKTSDDESRNTGVYQRGSKFIYIQQYYQSVKLYMLYNEELEAREEKKPSDTSIFGTNILLTLGVKIIGKETSQWFSKFNTLDDLIAFKNAMRKPPAGNVPITITKNDNEILVSGRLSKPAEEGNIGHDPNIGALAMISKCIRTLGWKKDIIITQHGVKQSYIDRTQGKNKFLYICKILSLKMKGLTLPSTIELPELYWHYEKESEKMASILVHVIALYAGIHTVYENHAGCERGYFRDKEGHLITLPKKDRNGVNLYLPDCVLYDSDSNHVLLIEGKKIDTIKAGLEEVQLYDSIEDEFIKPYYQNALITRCLSIFGGNLDQLPNEKVLIYVNDRGQVIFNQHLTPQFLRSAFELVRS